MLKFCGSLLHGTRVFGNQIGNLLVAENYLNFEAESLFSKIGNLQLKTLCNKMRKYNVKKNGLLGIHSYLTLEDLGILVANNFNLKSQIKLASRAVSENMGMLIFKMTFSSLSKLNLS